MKKLLVNVLILSLLLCSLPAQAEDVVATAAEALTQCATLDDQLAVLDALATDGAGRWTRRAGRNR